MRSEDTEESEEKCLVWSTDCRESCGIGFKWGLGTHVSRNVTFSLCCKNSSTRADRMKLVKYKNENFSRRTDNLFASVETILNICSKYTIRRIVCKI